MADCMHPMRFARYAIAVATATAIAACSSQAADIPQFVKGPISGLIYDCQTEKQSAPRPEAYVTRGDLDGDGQPDMVVDTAKGCAANRTLYCSAEGCSISVYVTLTSSKVDSFRVQSFAFVRHAGKSALQIIQAGPACGKADATCTKVLVYDAAKDVLVAATP